ncbi:MAG: hypothetical protein AB9842_00030 [Bacteroidales bacterium]
MKSSQYWRILKIHEKIIVLLVLAYALTGFFLTTIFFAIRLHLTDDPGAVNFNDRKFEETNPGSLIVSDSVVNNEAWLDLLENIRDLNAVYPYDARNILEVMTHEQNIYLVSKMLLSAESYLSEDLLYQNMLKNKAKGKTNDYKAPSDSSLYPWINTIEWKTLKAALVKEARPLDSIAGLTGISSRLLASMLIGEQIRLFDSKREAFKKWISPLKILVNETKISLGVMGIKEETAIKIENYLKDKQSVYYLGPEYENILDFQTNDIPKERYERLTDPEDHKYPYLYAALYLRQVMQQWKRSGYDISDRPGVLATLFNLGFTVSVPKPDPKIGGSRVVIQGKEYTFGALAREFYYSGELSKDFPY